MKVIFLDFDGVITIPPRWTINIDKLKNLEQIIDATDAKIVVSSSWRSSTIERTKNLILNHDDYNSINSEMKWFIDNIYDVTPFVSDDKYKGNGRGGEIQTWLDAHPEVENYVILDDDSDMMISQLYHFIQTDWSFGLTEREVQIAIAVLQNKRLYNSISLNYILRYEWQKKCEGLESLYNNEEFQQINKKYFDNLNV